MSEMDGTKKPKWASFLSKRMKEAGPGAKFCTPVPKDVTEADVRDAVKGDVAVSKKGRFVCVTVK